jgi:DNA end-binding protein Ku
VAKAARRSVRRTRGERRAEREPREARGVRAFWSGTISFGLVSVPVDLHSAVRSQKPALRMLAPDGTPLARRYRCPEHDRDVDGDELVRGYEVEPGEHVVVTDEELEALAPRASRDIDLRKFVPLAQLDPFRFERAYVLAPQGDSVKAYRLLAEVMEREERAGIATFVLRGKQHLVAILARGGVLHAETLRFAGEVRSPESVGLPDLAQAARCWSALPAPRDPSRASTAR